MSCGQKRSFFTKTLRHPEPPQIYFHGIPIKQVSSHCHLGIWLSENMTWTKHTQEVLKKVSRPLNLLKRMGDIFDRNTKLHLYKLFIRPKLEYGTCLFWGNITQRLAEDLENIQRQALLSVTNAYRHTSHTKLLLETGIEPLTVRRKYFGLCQLYKICNGHTPNYLKDLLPPPII